MLGFQLGYEAQLAIKRGNVNANYDMKKMIRNSFS